MISNRVFLSLIPEVSNLVFLSIISFHLAETILAMANIDSERLEESLKNFKKKILKKAKNKTRKIKNAIRR